MSVEIEHRGRTLIDAMKQISESIELGASMGWRPATCARPPI